jgi:hypothetical protein
MNQLQCTTSPKLQQTACSEQTPPVVTAAGIGRTQMEVKRNDKLSNTGNMTGVTTTLNLSNIATADAAL